MIKHYLVTLTTFQKMNVHAYLMTKDKKYVLALADKMCDIADDHGLTPLGVILSSELSNDGKKPDPKTIKQVRDILCKLDERAADHLKTAKDYHLSMFVMPDNHPDNEPLMKLH